MPVDTHNLTENSYQYIKKQMELRNLPPGARLVNKKLAAEIGVSTVPVREAILRLATEGFVEYIQGSGTFVRQISREDIDELFILRELLESYAAGEAALYLNDQQFEDLEFILDDMHEITQLISQNKSGYATPTQNNRWLDCDTEFHSILLKASRNRLLKKVIQDKQAITSVFCSLRNDHKYLTFECANETCESTSDLLQALKNREVDLSRSIMSQHIQTGRSTVLKYLRMQERGRS